MITIIWEDQRGVESKSFGPHELLLACVADATGRERWEIGKAVNSVPKKGNGNVVKALERDLEKLARPVCAVLDRDKAKRLLDAPADCFAALCAALYGKAPAAGDYKIVFLVENVETLLAVVCEALERPAPDNKPSPDDRDRLLQRAASNPTVCRAVRQKMPSFDRLVSWVVASL